MTDLWQGVHLGQQGDRYRSRALAPFGDECGLHLGDTTTHTEVTSREVVDVTLTRLAFFERKLGVFVHPVCEFEDLGALAVEAREHLLAILLRTSEGAGAWLI